MIDKADDADIEAAYQRRLRLEELPSCGICLVPFEEGDELKSLDCPQTKGGAAQKQEEQKDDQEKDKSGSEELVGQASLHMFHADCIKAWFEKKMECPLCRHSFEADVRQSSGLQPQ